MIKNIKETFETSRLLISDATFEDERKLQEICFTWKDKEFVDGDPFPTDYIKNCLLNGDLPPIQDASLDKYRLKKVVLKETNEVVGFFDLYYGFPSVNHVYLSIFVIDAKNQKMHFGKEVVEGIIAEGIKSSFEKIAIGVQLKNWKALKFWINVGFKSIMGYYGSSTLSDDNFAVLGLEKDLK